MRAEATCEFSAMGMMAISFVIFVLWTVAYVLLLAQIPLSAATYVLGLPVCLWLSNGLHELAHLAAYLCLRIEFRRLRISWLLFLKEDGALHFCFDTKALPFDAECACAYDKDIPFWKYGISLISGGLACAIAAPIAICLSLPLCGPWDSFLLCFGIAAGLNAAVNLLYPRSSDMTLLRRLYDEKRQPLSRL